MKTDLLNKIKTTLQNGDDRHSITARFIDTYPEISKRYRSLLKPAIVNCITSKEGILFEVDRSIRPMQFSWISDITNGGIEEDTGYIYILYNKGISYNNKSVYKIGRAIDVSRRIKELNRETGILYPYEVVKTYEVEEVKKTESLIHAVLYKGRVVPNREFFYAEYIDQHINLIETVINVFKV